MGLYEFYYIHPRGHVLDHHDQICVDDAAALVRAESLCAEFAVEVWQTHAQIGYVNRRERGAPQGVTKGVWDRK